MKYTVHMKYTRALTFENALQGAVKQPQEWEGEHQKSEW